MTKKLRKCIHTPGKEGETTLVLLPNRELVYPQKYYFQCSECKKFFIFTKEKDKYLPFEEGG